MARTRIAYGPTEALAGQVLEQAEIVKDSSSGLTAIADGETVFENLDPIATRSVAFNRQNHTGTQDSDTVTYSGRDLTERLSEFVSVMDYGAAADGVTDDTTAFQNATSTGKPVYVPRGVYFLSAPVTYTGRVIWSGEGPASTIISDTDVLVCTTGTGSRIDNITLVNKTTPWTIQRDPNNWSAIPTVVQSNDGYQPTVNDGDVWPSLSPAQQSQDIGPKLKFVGNSSDIIVSRIYGRFVSVLIFDAVNSYIRDSEYHGGKNFAAGALFWNIDGQVGSGNSIENSTIYKSSYSNAAFARNKDGFVRGCLFSLQGESGVKTWQNEVNGIDARCTNIEISDTTVLYGYFDGFDLSANYPHNPASNPVSRHTVRNVKAIGCRQTGYFGDGKSNTIENAEAINCGLSGYKLTYDNCFLKNCKGTNNNKSNAPSGEHEMNIIGDGNTIQDCPLEHFSAFGGCMYAPGANTLQNCSYKGGDFFLGNPGSIVAIASGNTAATGARVNQTVPGGVRQTDALFSGFKLYSEKTEINIVTFDLHPRSHQVANPSGTVRGILVLGESGNELGFSQLTHTRNGTLIDGLTVVGKNGGATWLEMRAPATAPDANATPLNGIVSPWIDESGNNIKFQVKYSNGTVKTATLALT
jgi:hypothetical protein